MAKSAFIIILLTYTCPTLLFLPWGTNLGSNTFSPLKKWTYSMRRVLPLFSTECWHTQLLTSSLISLPHRKHVRFKQISQQQRHSIMTPSHELKAPAASGNTVILPPHHTHVRFKANHRCHHLFSSISICTQTTGDKNIGNGRTNTEGDQIFHTYDIRRGLFGKIGRHVGRCAFEVVYAWARIPSNELKFAYVPLPITEQSKGGGWK